MSGNGSAPLPPAPVPPAPVHLEPVSPPPPPEQTTGTARRRWYQYLARAIFALFCIELGVLLVLAPWIEIYDRNIYQFIPFDWQRTFLSNHFRGALSALGFLNFIIALNELIDIVRPSARKR